MPTFGPFELVKRIGAGGFAELYAIPAPGGPQALKLFLPQVAPDERVRRALLRELEPFKRLRHPGIVEVYDAGEEDGSVWATQELIRGQPVAALVRKMREAGKALSLAEACFVVAQAAAAVEAAHDARGADGKALGLFHRDLSSQALLVTAKGEVKVTDFGTGRAIQSAARSDPAAKPRTAYFAPEQHEKNEKQPLDRRVDVFALGAILWELLAAKRLFPGKTDEEIASQQRRPLPRIDELVPGLPRELVEVIDQSLHRDRDRRIPSAGVLADVLQPFTTPETQNKLGSRIDALFRTFLDTFDEAWDEAKAQSPRPARAPVRATSEAQHSATVPDARLAELAAAAAAKRALAAGKDEKAAAKKAARDRKKERARDDGPRDLLREQRDREMEAERQSERDRALVVHPLLAARPARRMPKLNLPDDDGVDHRIGYSGEGTVSRLLRMNKPRPRRAMTIVGVLGATALILLAIFAYARVGIRAEEPPPPEQSAEATPPPVEPRDDGELPPEPRRDPPKKTAKGTVQLQSDVPAVVRQGRKELGMTPLTVTLPPGVARFELRTPDGRRSASVSVQVPAGGEVTRRVQLDR